MSGEKKYPMAEAVRAAYRAGEEDEALEPRVLIRRQRDRGPTRPHYAARG